MGFPLTAVFLAPFSSSSSSDSESEPAVEIDDKEEEDGETDQTRTVFGPMTKGELCKLRTSWLRDFQVRHRLLV